MRRGILRWTAASLLVIMGAACPAAGIAFASQAEQPAAQSGTLADLDREFLTVIQFANMWEIPMGALAAERGSTQTVRDVGAEINADHTKLDVAVRDMAAKYGHQLPQKPSSSTQSWMNEIESKQGVEFDKAFADRLRAAHGTVFGLIAEVRAGTRNDEIRDFAQQANNIVMKHMTLLESTGQVTSDHGMFSEAAARTTAYPENDLTKSDMLVALVVGLVMAGATLVVVRTFSARGSE